MAVVTISAEYGTGGSQIAPAVARELGLSFLDRAITVEVAERLQLAEDEVLALEEEPEHGISTFFRYFAPASGFVGVPANPVDVTPSEDDYREAAEQALREVSETGGVVLGRAAAVVLGRSDSVLHVRLTGPAAARERLASQLGGISLAEAAQRRRRTDHLRALYVRHLYRRDPADVSLYDMILDTTSLGLATATAAVVATARHRFGLVPSPVGVPPGSGDTPA